MRPLGETVAGQSGGIGLEPSAAAAARPGNHGRHVQVAVRGVSRVFGDVRAVDDVSLEIERGAFVSILGPSGCGKTTLLRIIVGLERPDRGRVVIDGVDVTTAPPNRRPTNLVFQHGALFPHMTVFENVAYGLKRKGWRQDRIRDRVSQLIHLTQLDGLEKRRPSQLSGGQARRVGLARALAPEPAVLLLDEPLSALDLKLRKEMQLQLRRIHQEVGTTFVYVTHDQEEALVMSDRIVLMRAGRIVQDSTPREIYTNPASVFVAGFIGETNLLGGMVASVDGAMISIRLDSGDMVRARSEPIGLPPGARCVLSVRPEMIRLNQPPGEVANRLTGRVAEAIYLGDHVRVRVRSDGGADVWVHVPMEAAAAGIGEGEIASVDWMPEDGRPLAAETEAASSGLPEVDERG